jgi:hypothetical protein
MLKDKVLVEWRQMESRVGTILKCDGKSGLHAQQIKNYLATDTIISESMGLKLKKKGTPNCQLLPAELTLGC